MDEINKWLSEWDPIGVGLPLSLDEYQQYANQLYLIRDNREGIEKYLVKLISDLGLNYDPNSSIQRNEIEELTNKINSLSRSQ